jgi:hypothetical protein
LELPSRRIDPDAVLSIGNIASAARHYGRQMEGSSLASPLLQQVERGRESRRKLYGRLCRLGVMIRLLTMLNAIAIIGAAGYSLYVRGAADLSDVSLGIEPRVRIGIEYCLCLSTGIFLWLMESTSTGDPAVPHAVCGTVWSSWPPPESTLILSNLSCVRSHFGRGGDAVVAGPRLWPRWSPGSLPLPRSLQRAGHPLRSHDARVLRLRRRCRLFDRERAASVVDAQLRTRVPRDCRCLARDSEDQDRLDARRLPANLPARRGHAPASGRPDPGLCVARHMHNVRHAPPPRRATSSPTAPPP